MIGEKQISKWADTVRATSNIPLRIVLWNGKQFDLGTDPDPRVTMHVTRSTALQYLLEPDLDNLGEGYIKGGLDLEGKLSDVMDIAYGLANSIVRTPTAQGAMTRLRLYFSNATKRDEETIRYRYDGSNDFYKLWLDENMVYSCAYFENGNEDLASAQLKRIDHILRKIQVQPGQKLLDIGCGWGALVLHAAQKFGAQCVGVTPSQNQFDLATERVKAAGLSDKIEIRLQDYRDVQGQFDCITSVGMFEHVGQENLEEYQKIRNLLADDGIVINHGITTTHPDNSPRAIGARSFIGRYVFPSGDLPPHLSLLARATQKVGLETLDIENLRPHYVRTLELWGENFEAGTDEVRKYIDDERFRLWGLYLACLAHAFAVDDLSLHQMVCYKPGKAPAEISWLSRQHMYSENIKH